MPAGKGEGERGRQGLTPATAGRGDGGGDGASFSSRGRTRELQAESLAILRVKPLNWGDVSAVEVNAARYLFPIPFFNSLGIQTAALETANSNSQFHTPMPTSKRSLRGNLDPVVHTSQSSFYAKLEEALHGFILPMKLKKSSFTWLLILFFNAVYKTTSSRYSASICVKQVKPKSIKPSQTNFFYRRSDSVL